MHRISLFQLAPLNIRIVSTILRLISYTFRRMDNSGFKLLDNADSKLFWSLNPSYLIREILCHSCTFCEVHFEMAEKMAKKFIIWWPNLLCIWISSVSTFNFFAKRWHRLNLPPLHNYSVVGVSSRCSVAASDTILSSLYGLHTVSFHSLYLR